MPESISGDNDIGAAEELERELLRIVNEQEPSLRRVIEWLSIPHWFDDRVLESLSRFNSDLPFVESAALLERNALLERWLDGSRAVLGPIRRAILDQIASADRQRYANLSRPFASIYHDIAENDGDVFDHVESVYHRLVAEPEQGTNLLLIDGITWKSEPFFAFEALERLVQFTGELNERKMLSTDGNAILQLIELYTHRKSVLEEEHILQGLKNVLAQQNLFQGELHVRLGLAKLQLGQTAAARESFEDALRNFEAMEFRRGIGDATRGLGRVALRQDDLQNAQYYFEISQRIFEDLQLRVSASHCIKSLAETAFYQGRYSTAEELFERALNGFEAMRGPLGEANTRVVYSQLLSARAQFVLSKQHLNRAARIYEEIDRQLGIANCLKNEAVALFEEERYDDSLLLLARAQELYERLDSASGRANCDLWSAACMTRLGRIETSSPLLDKAAVAFDHIGDRFGYASALRELGLVDIKRGRPFYAIDNLDRAIAEFRSVGNEIEARAAGVLLGQAAVAGQFLQWYPLAELRTMATDARDLFQEVGFIRHIREAEELLRALDAQAPDMGAA
jgi:tetratricopeptide (TPR) repeat protein